MPPAEPIMRRSSTAGTPVSTPTPLPTDMHPSSAAHSRNISRLEQSAEQMSASGSDLGDEIRRVASNASQQRENSIQSSRNGDISVVRPGMGERYGSSGSVSMRPSRRSSAAGSRSRYVSPGNGYAGSPMGSVHASLQRDASTRSSRLAQVSEPMMEGRPLDSPMTGSFPEHDEEDDDGGNRQVSNTSFGRRYDEIAGNIRDSLVEMVPSAQGYQNEGMRRESNHLEIEGTATPPDRPRSTDTYQEAQLAFKDFDGVHFSPETDELVEIDQHGNEVRRVSARSSSGGISHEAASLLRTPRARPTSYAEPPPGEDMVYYPAPVPRMLNLPKRLSQLPAASVQAKRRSQMLADLPPEARAAAPWLPPLDIEGSQQDRPSSNHSRGASSGSHGSQQRQKPLLNERMSANMHNLPPQLRSAAFFDHPSVQHDVRVEGESAVATLDSILRASATAPVRAFTDHPYAGDVRRDVYSPEPKKPRNSSSTVTASPQQRSDKKKRSSSIGTFFKRQSTDQLNTGVEKRASRASLLTDLGNEGGNKLKKRRSVLSLGDELDREQAQEQREAGAVGTPEVNVDASTGLIAGAQNKDLPDTPSEKRKSIAPTVAFNDDEQIQKDFDDEDALEDLADEEEDSMFVQPSTLLAELQVRKAQLKSRNRTAATAFPTGMHSTLLQLDAVEEINKRKRQRQRVALAWEDPNQRALEETGVEADEDVPLGVLFPGKEGRSHRKVGDGKDWDRPLGLMEKREMEDNEPLSSRRNRLQGNDTGKGRPPSPHRRPGTGLGLNTPQLQQDAQPEVVEKPKEEEEDSEHEGETLAQRMRRMRTKDALDGTIAHIEAKEKEGSDKHESKWSEEWASQFGTLDANKDKDSAAAAGGASKPSPALSQEENEPEGETLGQRRARLQREAAAAGGSRNTSAGSGTHQLRSSTSLANLLASNPTGSRPTQNGRAHTAAAGTLLHTSAQAREKARSALQSTNLRSSSYALDRPLVDSKAREEARARGMLAAEGMVSRAPSGGFGGGVYANGAGGASLGGGGMGQGGIMVGTPGGNGGMFASPTAGYFGGGGGGGYGYGQQQPQQMMGMGMNGYGYGYNPYQQQQQQMMGGGYGYPMNMNMGMPHHTPNPHGMLHTSASQGRWQGNAHNAGMQGGTYASFAQTGHLPGEEGFMGESGAGAGGVGAGRGGNGAIERWRMGVAGQ